GRNWQSVLPSVRPFVLEAAPVASASADYPLTPLARAEDDFDSIAASLFDGAARWIVPLQATVPRSRRQAPANPISTTGPSTSLADPRLPRRSRVVGNEP